MGDDGRVGLLAKVYSKTRGRICITRTSGSSTNNITFTKSVVYVM